MRPGGAATPGVCAVAPRVAFAASLNPAPAVPTAGIPISPDMGALAAGLM